MIDKKFKYILQRLVVNDVAYSLFYPFIYAGERLKASRYNYKNRSRFIELEKRSENIFKEKVVLHGPFKGMVYENVKGYGSPYYAKLLGSYEFEIHPFLRTVFERKYQSVHNIGCYDGYYTTGFALHWKGLPVYGYDSDKKVLAVAKELAIQNKVEKQIHFCSTFTREMADAMDTSRKLFLLDCEGDEMNIFTKENAGNFYHSDLIIELHLHLYPQAVAHFSNLFSASHNIEIVNSIPDHLKATEYEYPELNGIDYDTRHFMLAEREVFMQWMLLSSKIMAT